MNDSLSYNWLLAVADQEQTAMLGVVPTTPFVKLAKVAFVPGPTLDPGTLTEADFDGYAAQVCSAWGTPHLDANGQVIFETGVLLQWTPSGSTTPNTIFGYWIISSAGDLLVSGLLPTPKALNGPSTTLQISVAIPVAAGTPTLTVLP